MPRRRVADDSPPERRERAGKRDKRAPVRDAVADDRVDDCDPYAMQEDGDGQEDAPVLPQRKMKAGPSTARRAREVSANDDAEPPSDEPAGDEPAAGSDNEGAAAERHSSLLERVPTGNADDAGDQAARLVDLERECDELIARIPAAMPSFMNADGRGERLLITHIDVDNFKLTISYYGRHTIGPFHGNFTSIVGPNGSGKSNVIDSLLFVLGFRSNRTRAKKIANMIHKSTKHTHCDYCSVTVNFVKVTNADGATDVRARYGHPTSDIVIVPNSAFSVRRTARANNSSSYALDGRTASLDDIRTRLLENGFDLEHNRFLILQGEVEQIATMKHGGSSADEEGMLEYLEDIIGSSRLKPVLVQLQTMLDQMQLQRAEALERMKKAEERKQQAQGPARQAIEFFELKNKHTRISNKCVAVEEVTAVTARRDELKAEYDQLITEIQKILHDNKCAKENVDKFQKVVDRLKKVLSDQEDQLKKLVDRDEKLTDEMKLTKQTVKECQAAIDAERKKIERLRNAPAANDVKLRTLTDERKMLEEEVKEIEPALDEGRERVEAETRPLQKQHVALVNIVGERRRSADHVATQLGTAQRQLLVVREDEDRAQRLVDDERAKLAELNEQVAAESTKNRNATARMAQTREQLAKNRSRTQELNAQMEQLDRDVRTRGDALTEIETRARQARSVGQQTAVVQALMTEKRRGKWPDLFGRLGDLGAIDERYDVAISTTCAALDNLVCQSNRTAAECVDHLRSTGIGSATFIILDDQADTQERMQRPFESSIPRLFDLVRTDDKRMRVAFYHALANTLVADNINAATEVGLSGQQRHRVVTLKGEVVDPQGTMTGGGLQTVRGRIGQQVRNDEQLVVPDEQEQRAAQATLDEQRGRLQATRQELNELRRTIEVNERDINMLEANAQAAQLQVQELQKRVKTTETQLRKYEHMLDEDRVDEARLAPINERIEQLKQEQEEADALVQRAQTDAQAVQTQIAERTEELVGRIEKRHKDIKATLKSINKEKADMTKHERDIQNCEENIREKEEEMAKCATRREAIRAEKTELTERATEKIDDKNQTAAELADTETAQKEAEELHRELDVREQEADRRRREAREQLQQRNHDVQKANDRVKELDERLKTLKLYNLSAFHGLRLTEETAKAAAVTQADGDDANTVGARTSAASSHLHLQSTVDAMVKLEPIEDGAAHVDINVDDVAGVDMAEFETGVGGQQYTLQPYTDEQLQACQPWADTMQTLDELQHRITVRLQHHRVIDDAVIREYERRNEAYLLRIRDLEAITEQRTKLRLTHEKLRKMRLREFFDGFRVISDRLKEMYQTITIGGDAELQPVDTMDPFGDGIEFSVRPPKKSWKQIQNLSGGEKTLSSLALVFALHHYKPTPLYVMDEIDAALDFRNVSILAHYIKERTQNAQFIIISLRNNMFELADRLVGIYKTFDCTKHVVIDPKMITLGVTQEQHEPVQPLRPRQQQENDEQDKIKNGSKKAKTTTAASQLDTDSSQPAVYI